MSHPYVYRLQPSYDDHTVSCICGSTENLVTITSMLLTTRKLREELEQLTTGQLYTPDKYKTVRPSKEAEHF